MSFFSCLCPHVVSSSEVCAEPELQKEEKSGAKSPVEPKSPGTTGLEKPGKKVDLAKVLQKDKKRYREMWVVIKGLGIAKGQFGLDAYAVRASWSQVQDRHSSVN